MAERPTYNRVILVQLHVPAPDRRYRYARANRAAENPEEAMSVHKLASMEEPNNKAARAPDSWPEPIYRWVSGNKLLNSR